MNFKIEVRVGQIDNGFLVDYWSGESHKVFCSSMEEVVAAIQVAFAAKVVANNIPVQVNSSNSTGTVIQANG